MKYLEDSGLADRLRNLAAQGRAMVGICGGFQMLGRRINDPFGVESSIPAIDGLGLLDLETSFARDKQTTQAALTLRPGRGILAGTGGMRLEGYEIHMGESRAGEGAEPLADGVNGPAGAANLGGNVLGSYLHGFFDNLEFTRCFLNNIRRLKGLDNSEGGSELPASYREFKEREYDRLADAVEEHLPWQKLLALSGLE